MRMSQVAEPQVPQSASKRHQQQEAPPPQLGPRRPPVQIVPRVDLLTEGGESGKKPIPKPKPRSAAAAAAAVNHNNNLNEGGGGGNRGGNKARKKSEKMISPVDSVDIPPPPLKRDSSAAAPGDSDTMTRTKVILNEAADAVAKSFTKQTQGINKGRTTFII